jgi:hypothetical protein
MGFDINGEKVTAYVESLLKARDDGSMTHDWVVLDLVHTIAAAARGVKENLHSHVELPINQRIKHYEETR